MALVAATVLALLVSAATGIEELLRTPDLVDQAARSTGATPREVSEEQAIVPALFGVALGVHAVLVGAFVGLAIPVWRGSAGARIALCVTSGLSALCCGGLLALSAVLPDQPERTAFAEELSRLDEVTSPTWTYPASVISALVVAAFPIAVLALLLISPSNRFFREPPPAGAWPGYHHPEYGHYYGYYYPYSGQPAPPASPPAPPAPPASAPPGSGPPGSPPVPPA